ncbi:MAG: sulfotransferase domain-containing protein [Marmoricola sp.]
MTPGNRLTGTAKRLTPPSVRTTAKSLLRTYARSGSARRRLPNFLIIGAKRCGTTSLQSYLVAHPSVAAPFPAAANIKGVHYFDRNADQPVGWYRSFFPMDVPGRSPRVCGEASPYYFIHPRAAERAGRVVPKAKIIALLRDPSQRAISHYRDEVRNGYEPLALADALAAEERRIAPELARMDADEHYYSFVHEHLCYLTWGRYAQHLSRWLTVFPPEQVLVLRSEDLFERPAHLYREVTDFLELPPYRLAAFPRYNGSGPAEPDDAVLRRLRDYYAPYNETLVRLLPSTATWGWTGAP